MEEEELVRRHKRALLVRPSRSREAVVEASPAMEEEAHLAEDTVGVALTEVVAA
jgi:hypothetical protein